MDMYQHRRLRLLSERYADKIPTWDVINEFLSRPVNHYPLDYPIHYFKLAEKLFPQCHLIANEDTERTWDDFNNNSSRFYLYLQYLIANGARVDGIGMQYHLFSKKEVMESRVDKTLNAESLLRVLEYYFLLGRAIHVSEITLSTFNDGDRGEEIQAQMAENLYKIWFS